MIYSSLRNSLGSKRNPHVVDTDSDLESMAEQVDPEDIENDPTFRRFRQEQENMRKPYSYPNVDPQFSKEDFTSNMDTHTPDSTSSKANESEDPALKSFCEASYSSIYDLGRKIIASYPSPDIEARMALDQQFNSSLTKKQLYKALIKVRAPSGYFIIQVV